VHNAAVGHSNAETPLVTGSNCCRVDLITTSCRSPQQISLATFAWRRHGVNASHCSDQYWVFWGRWVLSYVPSIRQRESLLRRAGHIL